MGMVTRLHFKIAFPDGPHGHLPGSGGGKIRGQPGLGVAPSAPRRYFDDGALIRYRYARPGNQGRESLARVPPRMKS